MGFFDLGRDLLNGATMYDATITYLRRSASAENGVTCSAKVGKSHTVSSSIDGVTIHENWIDFIIPYNQLNFMPSVGDVIIYNGVRYAVNAPNDELCYRWHGLNQALRIHTQSVNKDGAADAVTNA